jgi:hypothetical protein
VELHFRTRDSQPPPAPTPHIQILAKQHSLLHLTDPLVPKGRPKTTCILAQTFLPHPACCLPVPGPHLRGGTEGGQPPVRTTVAAAGRSAPDCRSTASPPHPPTPARTVLCLPRLGRGGKEPWPPGRRPPDRQAPSAARLSSGSISGVVKAQGEVAKPALRASGAEERHRRGRQPCRVRQLLDSI